MKTLPRIHSDDILQEIEEWLQVIRTSKPLEYSDLRTVLNDTYHDIVNDPDMEPVLNYSRATQEAYYGMNAILPNTPETREYIAKGCTFIPVMLELIAIGYEIRRRQENNLNRVKTDTPVTH